MNIEDKDIVERCTGCGLCKYKCPYNAIELVENTSGFKYPKIDKTKCKQCGLCLKVCPSIQNKKNESKLNDDKHYAVKHKKNEVRKYSRSGGVFTAISDYVLDKHGVVYGAVFTSVNTISHVRAAKKSERDKMRDSKYVQSDITNLYSSIEKDLKNNKLVLFSGTPCQCAAMYNAFHKYENLILLDFICHGVPSQSFYRSYLEYLEKKYKEPVLSFSFRDKIVFPWDSHVEKIEFKNKNLYSKRYKNLFYTNHVLRKSCFKCNFILNKFSDITMGDYWGIENVVNDFKDREGVSVLIINTKKGETIFNEIKNNLIYIDTSENELPHYNLKRPTKMPDDYEEFWNFYNKNGFYRTSKKYGKYDFLHLMKHKLKDKIDRRISK